MCLGIPARITDGDTGHPDLATVDMGGVTRVVNIGLLDEPPRPGDWILVHMGFALSTMTASARPACASSDRSTTSAMGDRQMLPRHTRQTR